MKLICPTFFSGTQFGHMFLLGSAYCKGSPNLCAFGFVSITPQTQLFELAFIASLSF